MYLEKLITLPKSDKIALIGLGHENIQFLNWLIQTVGFDPSRILIADQKEVDLSQPILKHFSKLSSCIFSGDDYLKVLNDPHVKVVFKSPGIWSLKPEFESFRLINGPDSILSGLVFFFEKYRKQIIAITGTKGKSTTSSLLNHILKSSSTLTSHYCGNTTNISPYQFWTDINQNVDPNEYFVVEVSSFQLQDIDYADMSPKYGIITNYFIDHQDQHANPEEYWRAKDTLFAHQKGDELTLITETVIEKTQLKDKLENTFLITQSFAHEISSRFQTQLEGTHNEANLALALLIYLKLTDNSFISIADKKYIFDLVDEQILSIQSALSTYKPLAHRQQVISTFNSSINILTQKVDKSINLTVRFIDDGAATEPDAVIAAINTLTDKPNQYIWLFLAGKDKGVLFDGITKTILETQLKNRLFRINYCGKIGQNILTHLYQSLGANLQAPYELFKETVIKELISKEQIVTEFQTWLNDQISQLETLNEHEKIESILSQSIELNITLSPCGSSQDEFTNYIQRSHWYEEKVKSLLSSDHEISS